ncbi:MAG: methyltransferase domain-containing protein [Chloroflexota bacterium]
MNLDLHKDLIDRNQALWQRKPLLRRVYADLYQAMALRLSRVNGPSVELGSGMGSIREVLPDCIRTDLFPYPWLDRVENAYQLTFADASLANLLMVDVFHHLRYPGAALREFQRALQPGGRVILMEPGLGLLGHLVYGPLHVEPIGRAADLQWSAPEGWSADDMDYYAAQGNATRIFVQGHFADRLGAWNILEVKRIAALAYVGSGGYSGPQLYPDAAYPLVKAVERIFQPFPSLFATRLLVVLEKKA